jgi:ferredoxin-NADP reductase
MATYNIKLIRQEEVAEGTSAFYFEKPDGFQFKPGQFLRFTLIDAPETDDEGTGRNFSIASAPHEPELMIATRTRNTAFKRVLSSMAPGAEIEIKGPYGRMTLHEDASRPAVILTGGIGITPFRSVVFAATQSGLGHRLNHSNRRPIDAAFLEQLSRLAKINSNLQFVPTMTSSEVSADSWQGERGHINIDMLNRHVDSLRSAVFYIAGPAGLVSAMRQILRDAGVKEEEIRAEEFAGY